MLRLLPTAMPVKRDPVVAAVDFDTSKREHRTSPESHKRPQPDKGRCALPADANLQAVPKCTLAYSWRTHRELEPAIPLMMANGFYAPERQAPHAANFADFWGRLEATRMLRLWF